MEHGMQTERATVAANGDGQLQYVLYEFLKLEIEGWFSEYEWK